MSDNTGVSVKSNPARSSSAAPGLTQPMRTARARGSTKDIKGNKSIKGNACNKGNDGNVDNNAISSFGKKETPWMSRTPRNRK